MATASPRPKARVSAANKRQKSERIAALEAAKKDATKEVRAKTRELARPLTDLQKAAISFIAQGESPYSASVRAGYADGGQVVYRMLKDPAILALIDAEKKKNELSVQMTRTKVMEGLLEGIEMAKLVADPNAIIRGWREVGQMCGYYAPKKVEHTVNGEVVHRRIEQLDDDTLLKLVKGEITGDALNDVLDVEFTEASS